MAIKTSIPANLRKPGTFQEFDVTSGARGLIPILRLIALVGARTTAVGTGTNGVPTQMFSEKDGEDAYGRGSELSLMVRAAFKAGRKAGNMPQVWAVSLAEPSGAKATYTLTVTGPATAAGDVVFKISGRTLRAGVASGDSATTIASTIVNAVKAMYSDLPVTAASSSGVATLTCLTQGVNGNDIKVSVVSVPAGVTCTAAAGVAGTGSYDITASLDTLQDKTYKAIAIANHLAADVADLKSHIADVGLPSVKRWTFGYLAETGTLSTATTLATGANAKEVVITTAEDFADLPGEIAAQMATTVEAEEDVGRSFDGVELDLYGPPIASIPNNTEIETALAAGATPLVMNDTQDQAVIVRCVTTLTTISSVPFENLLDVSNVRVLFEVATQVDFAWRLAFHREKANTRTAKRVRTVTLNTLRLCEDKEWLQNVDAHIAELIVEKDSVVKTRFNVSIPNSVVPNLHQIAGVNVLFVE